MPTAVLFFLQESTTIEFDPRTIPRHLGPFERLIVIAFFVMALWIAVAVLHSLWGRVRKSGLEPARMCQRVRNLRVIGQTAPMVGLLGTTVGLISSLEAISYEQSTGLNAVAAGAAEALIMTAMGLAVGIVAHWAAAFVESGKPIK